MSNINNEIIPVTRDTVTKRVATIPLISGEVNEVRFNRGYPYYEVMNMGDSPVYLSGDKECIAEADGVYTVPAGGGKVARLDSNTIYLSGSGVVQVTGKNEAEPSFKSSSKGGESGGTAGKLDVLLPMQLIDASSNITVDLLGNISDYDEIHVWVHTGDGATITYPYSNNNYVIFPVKSEWTDRDEITVQVNGPKIWLKSVKDGLADNQILIGAYSGKRYYAVYGMKFGSGSGGGGAGGVDEAYVIGKMTQAINTSKAYTDELEAKIPSMSVDAATFATYATNASDALNLGGIAASDYQLKINSVTKTVSANTQYKFFNLDIPANTAVLSVVCDTARHFASFWKSDTSWCATVFNNQSPTVPVGNGDFTFTIYYL